MDYKDPTSEQIEKLKDMSHEEIRKLAAEEGLPLSDEDLDQVAWNHDTLHPRVHEVRSHDEVSGVTHLHLTWRLLVRQPR